MGMVLGAGQVSKEVISGIAGIKVTGDFNVSFLTDELSLFDLFCVHAEVIVKANSINNSRG